MSRLRIISKAIFAIAAISVAIFGVYVFLTGAIFRIQHIDVQLADEASQSLLFEKIKESLDTRLSKYQGRYVWGVDLGNVLDDVAKDMRIKNVDVSRRLPNELHVQVEPYTPILNILARDKKVLHPVARDGEVLPSVPALEAIDSPILLGDAFLRDKDLRMQAVQLTLALSESGALSYRTVSEITFDKKRGFQLRLQNLNLLVWVGFEDFQTRIDRAQRVVEYLHGEQMAGRIIDARFNKKVVVRLRNDP